MDSDIATSLLLQGFDPQSLVAEVIGAEATATTYILNCPSGTDGNDCGTYNVSVTLGPWASKTVPAGAASTGVYDMYITDPSQPWKFSMHCEMSRTVAEKCTTTNLGGNDDGSPTATFSAISEAEYLGDFVYVPVTITAGQAYLDSTFPTLSTPTATGGASKSADSAQSGATGATTAGSQTSGATNSNSAATPTTSTSGASSYMAHVLAAVSAAGIAAMMLS